MMETALQHQHGTIAVLMVEAPALARFVQPHEHGSVAEVQNAITEAQKLERSARPTLCAIGLFAADTGSALDLERVVAMLADNPDAAFEGRDATRLRMHVKRAANEVEARRWAETKPRLPLGSGKGDGKHGERVTVRLGSRHTT